MSIQSKLAGESKESSRKEVLGGSLVADTFARLEHFEFNGSFEKVRANKSDIIVREKSTLIADSNGVSKKFRSTKLDHIGDAASLGEDVDSSSNLVGQQYQSSDPIICSHSSFRGPLFQNKISKKKALVDIYKSLKIPYAPSYFTTLLHSQINPKLKLNSHKKSPLMINEVEDSNVRD